MLIMTAIMGWRMRIMSPTRAAISFRNVNHLDMPSDVCPFGPALPRRRELRRERGRLAGFCPVCRNGPVAADPEGAREILTHDQVYGRVVEPIGPDV
jgi:hypothetical protein